MLRNLLRALVAVTVCVAVYLAYIVQQIHATSNLEEARPADVIVIMGAAEYRGRPSPVLKARLDHGLQLYQRGLAPIIVTTGGAGGDPVFTEGEVGRAYLARQGIPSEAIIVEPEGESTVHSTAAVAEIMNRMNLRTAILVSDGYHIFRAKKMLESRGFKVFGSPRPSAPPGGWKELWLYIRQSVAYLLWQIGIAI